jgi:hypothetical protein
MAGGYPLARIRNEELMMILQANTQLILQPAVGETLLQPGKNMPCEMDSCVII